MLKLSQRLQVIAQMVPSGAKVVDIGTDHAFLPCYLILAKIAPRAVGVDVNKGPYEKACATVHAYNLGDRIEIRLGNGLAAIRPAEVDTVIIARMGGTTIRDILAKSPQVMASVQKVILQPMTGAEVVRFWLYQQGWFITEEELIYEDNQYYQVIGAEQRETAQKDDGERRLEPGGAFIKELEAAYGTLLIKNRHPLLPGLLQKDIAAVQEILLELAKSRNEQAKKRYNEYLFKVEKLKELKEWLLAAKS